MKKNYIAVLALLLGMMLLLSACGKEETVAPVSEEVDPVEETVSESAAGEVEEEPAEEAPQVLELELSDFQLADLGDGTCEILSCFAEAEVLEIPETIGDLTVVGIGSYAFSSGGIEEIVLPDTVTYIANEAFNNCYDLKTIDLGDGLKRIGSAAFCNCSALKSVEFPEGIEEIGGTVFMMTYELEEVYIPASATVFEGSIAMIELCPNIVIVTPAGSVAEEMAIAAGLPVRNS